MRGAAPPDKRGGCAKLLADGKNGRRLDKHWLAGARAAPSNPAMGPTDASATLGQLKSAVRRFSEERDWAQFHSLKNLSMALAIEAAELMEPFQWLAPDEADRLPDEPARRQAIEEELADVVIYALQFANRAEIDLAAAIAAKIAKNARKYPVDLSRGSADRCRAPQ